MFFFFMHPATTDIYTLSLHDALPISPVCSRSRRFALPTTAFRRPPWSAEAGRRDRKSTRLNSSHANISYAVFCLKKKNFFSHSHHECYTRTSQTHSRSRYYNDSHLQI